MKPGTPYYVAQEVSLRRALPLLVLILAAIVLPGCPLPNNYAAVPALPQARWEGMVGMQWLPDDPSHALILTREGIIWRISTADPSEPASAYLDLRERMLAPPLGGEEGLLGMALAPDFPASGRLYVHYTAEGGGGPPGDDGRERQGIIARLHGDNRSADPASHEVILTQPQPFENHNGGALAFGPDGYLYVAFGDGGAGGDPLGNAQSLDTLLGKILRIDVSGPRAYSIPSDNPFVGAPNARGEIWAYGLRNPWRLSFDRATGVLWTADVGQNRVEEVDRIVKAGNYGWSLLEGTHCHPGGEEACGPRATIPPVAEYTHEFGCAVTGGYVYRGSAWPELAGWYVYGDFCSGRIWAVSAEGGAPIPLADTDLRIASFAEDPAGEIYIMSFGGTVARLVRK